MSAQEPIAVVGIACEFPGDIHSPSDLWDALINCRDLHSELPADRTDLLSYCAYFLNAYDSSFRKKLLRYGYFLSDSLFDSFEPSFFGLSDGEAASIDPCHRLLMLKMVHLLEDAGYAMEAIRGSRTSVHIGQFSGDATCALARVDLSQRPRLHATSHMLFNASARLAYHFDLLGPNLSLNTACSSSLQALHLSVLGLRAHESNMAVCGGVNSIYTPDALYDSSIVGVLSSEGQSRSFSSDASGYAKGEAVVLVLLKRLSDAERDGDRIYCVVRDVMSNHDGCQDKNSFLVPSPTSQNRLLSDIYQRAKYNLGNIFYVEAHGTGTPVGDPIEANILGNFFRRTALDPPLLIGSIKSNVGHSEGAAGLAGLIKAAMCMTHRTIPPNMNFTAMNPKIQGQQFNMHVVQSLVPFPPKSSKDSPTTAIAINSFGIGGNNAHAIVEEYQPMKVTLENEQSPERRFKQHFIFVFSAKTRESLHQQIVLCKKWMEKFDCHINELRFLARLSRRLILKRTISYDHSATFIAADREGFYQQIDEYLLKGTSPGLLVFKRTIVAQPRVCFVFSGQGPQWWAMGRQLYEAEPIFREWIEKISEQFRKINNDEWNLLDELMKKNESESHINDTNLAQPALFATQVALAALLISWNIYPNVIVSHSAGEQTAAFISGRVTFSEAIRIVYHRSRLQHRNTRQGGRMLAIAMSEKEVRDLLLRDIEHHVCVGAVNSPRSVMVSGEATTINELQDLLSTFYPDTLKSQLRIENAFHSHQMDRFGIEEEMISSLKDIVGRPLQNNEQMFNMRCAQAHLYSSVTGNKLDDETPLDKYYWWKNVRQCVRFADAVHKIIENERVDIVLEISPHPVLMTSIHECYEGQATEKPLILPTLKRKEDEQVTLLTTMTQIMNSSDMWQSYMSSRFIQSGTEDDRLFDTFPLYPFHKTSCWYEPKECVIERLANSRNNHPLLGVRQWTKQTSPTWRNVINLKLPEFEYLRDHMIEDIILFPAAGFLELALAACHQLLPLPAENEASSPIAFEKVQFIKSLPISDDKVVEIVTQVVMPLNEWSIYSRPWVHAGKDLMRSKGMSGRDVLDSFADPQSLNEYSLNEFTLHARGRIDFGMHLNVHATSALRFSSDLSSWHALDRSRIYSFLESLGYQYGKKFQVLDSIKCTKQQVTGYVSQADAITNDKRYHIHPILFDGCLHSSIPLLKAHRAYVPVGIERLIIFSNTYCIPHFSVFGEFHPVVNSTNSKRSYTATLSVFDSRSEINEPNTMPVFICETLEMKPSWGNWASLDKTLFTKVNEMVDFPNADLSVHIDQIESECCYVKKWSCTTIEVPVEDAIGRFSEVLIEQVDAVNEKSTMNKDASDQMNASIEYINSLAAHYALYALKHLITLNNSDLSIQSQLVERDSINGSDILPLFRAVHQLVCDENLLDEHGKIDVPITNHSIQFLRKEISEKFPLWKPLLKVLHHRGSQLGQLLSGEKKKEDIFQEKPDEIFLQDTYTLLLSAKIHLFLNALIEYLSKYHLEEINIVIFGSYSCHILLPVITKLKDLATEQHIHVKVFYVDAMAERLDYARVTFESVVPKMDETNGRFSMEFELYDIQECAKQSKITEEKCHIGLAVNLLSTAPDAIHSLHSMRRLIAPGALLFLVELTKAHPFLDLVFGTFPYWWRNDGSTRALLTDEQWKKATQSLNGFTDSLKVISTAPLGDSLIILQKTCKPLILNQLVERQEEAWLIFNDENFKFGHLLAPRLPTSNITILELSNKCDDICKAIKNMLKNYRKLNILFAWPLNAPYLDSTNDDEPLFEWQLENLYNIFIGILKSVQEYKQRDQPLPFIFILTQSSQAINNGRDISRSYTSSFIGFARSLIIEYDAHRIKFIDLQPSANNFIDIASIRILAQHLINSKSADDLDDVVFFRDSDDTIVRYKWHYERIKSKRLEPESSVVGKTIIPQIDWKVCPFKLEISPSRIINQLAWISDSQTCETLSPDEIEVIVHYVGINFRDALKASGRYPYVQRYDEDEKDQHIADRDDCFGSDFTGVIQRSHCRDVFVGDRVFGMTLRGAFRSHVIVNKHAVLRIPKQCSWSDAQLSSIGTPLLTAIYSLKHRIHLQPHQTVLIHAATGATGQMFIQYCQLIGAQIIATAGTAEKRRFLREHYGIEHIYNSRDLSFVAEVLAIYPNGVNVIVNSLSGVLLEHSMKLLSINGHFIELGKEDLFSKRPISLFNLRRDCSFHSIDLTIVGANQPQLFRTLLQDFMELILSGAVKPVEPTHVFEPSDVIEAFNKVLGGISMGKLVIKIASSDKPLIIKEKLMNSRSDTLKVPETMFPRLVTEQGTVLISGGFGGLGLTMSRWMIEKHGVKRIALMTRRSRFELEQFDNNPQLEHWQMLQKTATQHGALIDVIQADATRFEDVKEIMARLSKTYPVRGVIHAAVVSEDRLLQNLNKEIVKRSVQAKVRGAWNLHRSSEAIGIPLHFFIMFSSIRNHFIDPGSSSYNAGNEFLDTLAHYRHHHLKQTTLSISLPGVIGAGMFHRQRDVLTKLYSEQGLEVLPTVVVFELIERLFNKYASFPCPIILPINWKLLKESENWTSIDQINRLIKEQSNPAPGSVETSRNLSKSSFNLDKIVENAREAVAHLLGSTNVDRIDIHRSLFAQGMDSISVVALQNWISTEWDVQISLAKLIQGVSISSIGNIIYEKIKEPSASNAMNHSSSSSDEVSQTQLPQLTSDHDVVENVFYKGMEKLLDTRIGESGPLTVFCICTKDIHSPLEKLLQGSTTLYTIHALYACPDLCNNFNCAKETIAQMRRLQPHGPYYLFANDEDAKAVIVEMLKQLEKYKHVGKCSVVSGEFWKKQIDNCTS